MPCGGYEYFMLVLTCNCVVVYRTRLFVRHEWIVTASINAFPLLVRWSLHAFVTMGSLTNLEQDRMSTGGGYEMALRMINWQAIREVVQDRIKKKHRAHIRRDCTNKLFYIQDTIIYVDFRLLLVGLLDPNKRHFRPGPTWSSEYLTKLF